jgi:hypothetical protein
MIAAGPSGTLRSGLQELGADLRSVPPNYFVPSIVICSGLGESQHEVVRNRRPKATEPNAATRKFDRDTGSVGTTGCWLELRQTSNRSTRRLTSFSELRPKHVQPLVAVICHPAAAILKARNFAIGLMKSICFSDYLSIPSALSASERFSVGKRAFQLGSTARRMIMRRFIFVWALLTAGISCVAQAQFPAIKLILLSPPKVANTMAIGGANGTIGDAVLQGP